MQVKTGLWVLVVMAGLLLGLWGCGNGSVGGAVPTIVQGTIGSAGGNVVDGNLTVGVPGSALTQSTVFSLEATPASQYPANNTLVPGTAFTIASTASTLNAAVTVSIRYNAATIPRGVQEANLQLYQVVSGVWTLVTGSTIDINNKVASGTTTTLGVFGILSSVASTASTGTTGGTTTAGGTTGGTTTGSKTTNLLFLSDSGSSTVITSTGTQTLTVLGLFSTTLGGTATQTIVTPGVPAEQIGHASFSPDAKTVVYDSANAAAPLIALGYPNGTTSQILVTGGVSGTGATTTPRAPSFSADGTKIVFVYNQTGTDQIYTMSATGTNMTQITRNFTGTNIDLPAFTKTGSISFLSTTTAGVLQYNLVGATGGNVTSTSAFGPTVAPWYTYSPDGTKIVYVAQSASARSDVYLINADGSNVTQLTKLSASAVGNARFSADGTKVIFDAATTAAALRAVYTVSLTGTSLQTLALSTGSSANNFLADAR